MLTLESLDERIKNLKQELIQKREALKDKAGGVELRPLRKQLKRFQRRRRLLRAHQEQETHGQKEKRAKPESLPPPQTAGGEAARAE